MPQDVQRQVTDPRECPRDGNGRRAQCDQQQRRPPRPESADPSGRQQRQEREHDKGAGGQEHVAEHVVGAHVSAPPDERVQELADGQPPQLERENPDHHQRERRRERREQRRPRDGRGVLKHTASAPRDRLAEEEPDVEGHRRRREKQHHRARQSLRQHLHHRARIMAEGNAEVPGEGVFHVGQVLLPKGLVQPERRLDLLPHLHGDIGIQGVERRVVAGLRLHQEERQGDDQEQRQDHLAGPPHQVACHRSMLPVLTVQRSDFTGADMPMPARPLLTW